jgi:hypothetical protein
MSRGGPEVLKPRQEILFWDQIFPIRLIDSPGIGLNVPSDLPILPETMMRAFDPDEDRLLWQLYPDTGRNGEEFS